VSGERSRTDKIIVVVAQLVLQSQRGAARVAQMRMQARRALGISALSSGAEIDVFAKDSNDVPLPNRGWFWSLSHCPTHVAAAVHHAPIGVDVESSRDVKRELVERVLTPSERGLLQRGGEPAFLRGWTAKEAVLKELGLGLGGLSRCTITACEDDGLVVECDAQRRRVRQLFGRERIVAVSSRDDAEVEWRDYYGGLGVGL
jgi:phosphopantetheinyl transferase